MQRSHCENENVQFVQELAEVDGPFESPININFRDLTKLELPPLVWNRAEVSPKKMKITNTGHTVIISGKWKCERPYLTGGPLSGKYVFSQIHFHWGQDDCKGSEHQVCGEGFPLEMHVAHFKTEYLTQECALREKDGMVVVVYLFKLQDEPNASLKKILNLLPNVKQASTSHAIDPKPILSLCNPFTEDYFMYWGSVVTSTCAHILLWIISREPFGISREQVNEFRKILDTSHQPICRNSRETQPLHRRNVFHVNASKHLSDALLPIKKVLGCYCRGSEDNVSSKTATNDCKCQAFMQNQEDVEGNTVEHEKKTHFSDTGGKHGLYWKASLPGGCFTNQSIFVQTATIHSVPMLVKRFDSEPVRNLCCLDDLKPTKSEGDTQLKSASKSCCFLSTKEVAKIKSRGEKRNVREKKNPFNSVRAFSQLMDSLEAIKNQTFKKLKEIESINQEIKGMKPFCQDTEDKKWLRKIEKIISRQKRFTLKSSQGCFSELKKLARECNFDKFFDGKVLPQVGDHNQKMLWLNDNELGSGALPYSYNVTKEEGIPKMETIASKHINSSKVMKFSAKAQRLIQSFFEDIKESDGLQETVKKDLDIKRIESFYNKQAGDSSSISALNKGFITQKMFILGNLGDRFFTAVSTDDFGINENEWPEKKLSMAIMQAVKNEEPVVKGALPASKSKTGEDVSLLKNDISTEVAETSAEAAESMQEEPFTGTEEKAEAGDPCRSESPSKRFWSNDDRKSHSVREYNKQSLRGTSKEGCDLFGEKPFEDIHVKATDSCLRRSSSDLESTESMETHSQIVDRMRKRLSRKDLWEEKPSALFTRVSSKGLYEKNYKKQKLKNVHLGGYSMKKKKLKKKGSYRRTDKTSWDLTSTSKEETKAFGKSTWKRLSRAKFRLEFEKSSESTIDYAIEGCLISPERKKLKLEYKKSKAMRENKYRNQSEDRYCEATDRGTGSTRSNKYNKNENMLKNTESLKIMETKFWESKPEKCLEGVALRASYSQKSVNESGTTSRASMKKTSRASSVDSRKSYLGKQDSKMLQERGRPSPESLKQDFQILAGSKLTNRNRSLNNITTSTIHSTETNHRVFVETIDDRRQSPEFWKRKESPKKMEERPKLTTIKDLSNDSPKESDKKFDEHWQQKDSNQSSVSPEKTIGQAECNAEFSSKTSKQMDEKILSKEGEGKTSSAKRCDTHKYHYQEMGLQESKDFPELSLQADSEKSSVKVASKSDGDFLKNPLLLDNKELQGSNSQSNLKKNSTSTQHSAETVISQTKIVKQKCKKRLPCKRSSKHHMKKNSSAPRKPKKVEKKELDLLHLTDEEQLKIISANVAKYLKQKLVEQISDTEKKCSLTEINEVMLNNLASSQAKTKEKSLQNSCATKETEKIKANVAPVVTVKEKTKKREKSEKAKKVEKVENVRKVEKVQKIENVQKVENVRNVENVENVGNVENLENLETLENVENTEKVENVGNVENVENVDNVGNIDNVENVENVGNVDNVDNVEKKEESKEEKPVDVSKKEKPTSPSPKPVHNFIKRNKQLAGKYKRTVPPPEKPPEPIKKEEEKPVQKAEKVKHKPQYKRRKSPQKQDDQLKSTSEVTSPMKDQKPTEKSKRGSRIKSPRTPKKPDSKNQKTRKKTEDPKPEPPEPEFPEPETLEPDPPEPELPGPELPEPGLEPKPMAEAEQPNQLVQCESSPQSPLRTPIALRKIPQPKKRLVPAYMLTSYLPAPIEIVQSQKRKMNKYLLGMNDASLDNYFPEVLQETKSRKTDRGRSDPVFEKELEYLIKLQMCLNEEITANIENSMNYVKTLFRPDYPSPYWARDDPGNSKGVVLVEMKDLDFSSSGSDLNEEIARYCLGKEKPQGKSDSSLKDKHMSWIKMPKESGDSGAVSPLLLQEAQENSDSSYDCKISITLNPNGKESEGEIQSYDTFTYLGENSNSQTTICLAGSSSQSTVTRPHRKKRKENEISVEMKQKLLEILEGEIKREIEMASGISPEISSDGLAVKWEDSDANNRSQSTESSCDNIEMLTQISETMKQYLSDFKERRREEIITESSDKESRDDE